jgi:quercetin dioxygenase-like cupin family protein
VPVTVQCLSGSGVFTAGDPAKQIPLTPGVLVTLEANTLHEILAQPAVSILLTRFVAG